MDVTQALQIAVAMLLVVALIAGVAVWAEIS